MSIYQSIQDFIKKIKFPVIDIHYDEMEYLEFNNNIIQAIIDNYDIEKALVDVDRSLYQYSSSVERGKNDSQSDEEMVSKIISSGCSSIEDNSKKNQFLLRVKKYLLGRLPYDFHYAKKSNIEEGISSVMKK